MQTIVQNFGEATKRIGRAVMAATPVPLAALSVRQPDAALRRKAAKNFEGAMCITRRSTAASWIAAMIIVGVLLISVGGEARAQSPAEPPSPPNWFESSLEMQATMYMGVRAVTDVLWFVNSMMIGGAKTVYAIQEWVVTGLGSLMDRLIKGPLAWLIFTLIFLALFGWIISVGARFLTPSFQISTPDRIIVITVLAVYLLSTGSKAMLAFEDWRNAIARGVFDWTYELTRDAPINIGGLGNNPGASLSCRTSCRGYHIALAYLYAAESDLGVKTPVEFQRKYFSAGGSPVDVLELFNAIFSAQARNELLSRMMGGPGRMLEGLAISYAAILESLLAFLLSLNAILLFIALPIAVGFAVFTPFGGGLSAAIMQGVEVIKTSAMVGLVLGIVMGLQVKFQNTPLVVIGINFIAGLVYWGLIAQAWKLLGSTFSVTSGTVTSTVGAMASPVTDAAKEGAMGGWNVAKNFSPALGGVEWAAKNPQQAGMLTGTAVGAAMGNPFVGAQVGGMVGSVVASGGQRDTSPVPAMAGQMLVLGNTMSQTSQGAAQTTSTASVTPASATSPQPQSAAIPQQNTNAASALTRGYQTTTAMKDPDAAKQSAFRLFDDVRLPKQRAGQAFALLRDAQDAQIPASDFERMVGSVARGDRASATKIATTYVGAQNAELMVNRASRIAGNARVARWSSPRAQRR
jgi:hypothetical protein